MSTVSQIESVPMSLMLPEGMPEVDELRAAYDTLYAATNAEQAEISRQCTALSAVAMQWLPNYPIEAQTISEGITSKTGHCISRVGFATITAQLLEIPGIIPAIQTTTVHDELTHRHAFFVADAGTGDYIWQDATRTGFSDLILAADSTYKGMNGLDSALKSGADSSIVQIRQYFKSGEVDILTDRETEKAHKSPSTRDVFTYFVGEAGTVAYVAMTEIIAASRQDRDPEVFPIITRPKI